MTEIEKQQFLDQINYLNNQFFLARLGNPDVDFLYLESAFTAVLKSYGGAAFSKWEKYRDNSFKQRGIIPDYKIYLDGNRGFYAETIISFLGWFYDEVSSRNARELPYQNVPIEQIKILEKEYDEHLKQLQETKSRWLALIKEHNQGLMDQLGRELPGVADESKQQLARVVIKNYGEAQRSAQINHQEKDNLALAKQTVEEQEKLLAALGLTPQQSAGLLVRSFENLDQKVPVDWWFQPDPTDTPAQILTVALELEHQRLVSRPISWHERQVVAELDKQGFSQDHVSLVSAAIINAQKYYQGELKPDNPESVVKLSLAIQGLLVFAGGPELSPTAITELLTRAHDTPTQPEKRGFIRQMLYATTKKQLLSSAETNLADFIANRQEQINRFIGVFQSLPGKFFPDFSKLSAQRLVNVNQLLETIRQLVPTATAAGKPLPFWQGLFQGVFSLHKVSFGPVLNRVAEGAAGFGRTLFGWAGKGLTPLLGWGARAAAGTAAGAAVGTTTLPVWVIVLLVVGSLALLGFLPGFGSSFDTITTDTAALLPAPRYGDTGAGPGGVGPPVPPGEYIPPGGCAATQTMGVCCVPLEGWCSVSKLAPAWGSLVDGAAQVCLRESGGDTAAVNEGCLVGRSAEYSVGLFQFNMLYTPSELAARGINCGDAFGGWDGTTIDHTCYLKDLNIFEKCRNYLLDPNNSIKIAKQKYDSWQSAYGGTEGWHPWSAARCNPGLCALDTCHTTKAGVTAPCDCK